MISWVLLCRKRHGKPSSLLLRCQEPRYTILYTWFRQESVPCMRNAFTALDSAERNGRRVSGYTIATILVLTTDKPGKGLFVMGRLCQSCFFSGKEQAVCRVEGSPILAGPLQSALSMLNISQVHMALFIASSAVLVACSAMMAKPVWAALLFQLPSGCWS